MPIYKDWPGLLVLPFPVPSAHFLGKEVILAEITRNKYWTVFG